MPEIQKFAVGGGLQLPSVFMEAEASSLTRVQASGSAPRLRSSLQACGELLLLGHDETLQRTRTCLFERVGFSCRSVRGSEILSIARDRYKLVLICHTVAALEACQAAEQVTLQSPSTMVLRLSKFGRAEETCFPHVLVAPTPDLLVVTVQWLSSGSSRADVMSD